jgi:hypothetical protein
LHGGDIIPNLGDYIGHLMSELTIARMNADIETIRIAELYASHNLLRHMPVPHFRLPTVDLDVPVVIKKIEEDEVEGLPRGTPSLKEMRKIFEKIIPKELSKNDIQLKPVHKNKIKSLLDDKEKTLAKPNEISIDVFSIADDLTTSTISLLSKRNGPIDPNKRMNIEEKLKNNVRNEFLKIRKTPQRLKVLITTSEIREAGPTENVTHLHLKINEEAFEWTTIDSDGKKKDRLIIE